MFKRILLACLGPFGLVAACLVVQGLSAQPAATASVSTPSSAQVPQMPPAKSPLDFFRELLSKNAAEQVEFLTNRSLESQKLILAKVREYERLSPEQRELRLRVTELHFYLVPLMNIPATNRSVQMASIPAEVRKLVEDRLEQWDALAPGSQSDLLQNEATLRTLNDLATRPPANQKEVVTTMTSAQKAELEAGIRRWQALSDDQRHATVKRFNQFFDLTPGERDKALATLSEPERQQLDRTLTTFEELSPIQRVKCVRSFQKFADLSAEERQQFLKSAEHWKNMSPSQRQLWRDLVYNLSHSPPLPPGVDSLPPRPPARPPSLPTTPGSITATN